MCQRLCLLVSSGTKTRTQVQFNCSMTIKISSKTASFHIQGPTTELENPEATCVARGALLVGLCRYKPHLPQTGGPVTDEGPDKTHSHHLL